MAGRYPEADAMRALWSAEKWTREIAEDLHIMADNSSTVADHISTAISEFSNVFDLQVWTQEDEDDLRAFEAEQADKETATTCPMMGTFVKSKLKMR